MAGCAPAAPPLQSLALRQRAQRRSRLAPRRPCLALPAGSRTLSGVRLTSGGTPTVRAGRLEVRVPGRGWGVVCRNWDSFGDREANVTCRSLGYQHGVRPEYNTNPDGEPAAPPPTRHGGGKLPVLALSIECPRGSEANVAGCILERSRPGYCYEKGHVEVECS